MTQTRTRSRRNDRRHAERAFTLLEVIVAVTIVALLATLVVPRLIGQIGNAKTKLAKTETASLAQQVKLYMVDNGLTLPPNDFNLDVLVGEYLENADDLLDPWDRPYQILVPGTYNTDFDVISYGRDGEQGGNGEDADIVNGQD